MSNANNDKLCEAAKAAIDDVFEDDSVDVEHAIVNLNDLRDHIESLIDSLEYNQK